MQCDVMLKHNLRLRLQLATDYYFRCRILARLRRFLRPILRRPFPVLLVPTERSVQAKKGQIVGRTGPADVSVTIKTSGEYNDDPVRGQGGPWERYYALRTSRCAVVRPAAMLDSGHFSPIRGKWPTVCHCFAEAVQGVTRCSGTVSAKQWHTAVRNAG